MVKALDEIVDKTGLSEEAKECAYGALMQLCPERKKVVLIEDPDALHIMMSCKMDSCLFHDRLWYGDVDGCLWCVAIDQWDVQGVIKKIVADLVSTHATTAASPCHYHSANVSDRLLVPAATPQVLGVVRP